jgi:hypothetical protein
MSLIREHSPTNFKYVETWNMFCSMAHNLAIASLILVLCSGIKAIFQTASYRPQWFLLANIAFVLVGIFTQRAVRFSIWAAHDINATISRFDLLKRKNAGN